MLFLFFLVFVKSCGSVGDSIEIADLKTEKKVKSMQMFRCPIDVGKQGDRLGICVTQFDAEKLERGIVCYPKSVKTVQMCLVSFSRIRYFQVRKTFFVFHGFCFIIVSGRN